MDHSNNGYVVLFVALVVLLVYSTKIAENESKFREPEMSAAEGNFTTITLSGEMLTIKVADGYTPVIETRNKKPLIILQRDGDQATTKGFNTVTVLNKNSISVMASGDL